MATLLDYGAGPEHKSHMHPFFRKASVINDPPSNRPPSRTLGLDGTVEDGSTNHEEDSGHVTHTETAEATPIGSWRVNEDDGVEYKTTRRKRRRVSASPKHLPTETTKTSNTNHMTWAAQPQSAVQIFKGVETYRDCAEDQTLAGQPSSSDKDSASQPSLPILPEDGSSRSRRLISPVQSLDASSHSVDIDLTISPDPHPRPTDDTVNDQLSKESKPNLTPKDKMLRTGHGKLIFSPKKSPKRAPRTVAAETSDADKTTNRSKKLEMKNGRLVSSLRVTLSYSAADSGAKINDILSSKSEKGAIQTPAPQAKAARGKPLVGKTTHPFFLGRIPGNTQKQSDLTSETSSIAAASEDEITSRSKAPKPWKDIIFESKRTFQNKNAPVLPPVWPPTNIQHVRPTQIPSNSGVGTLPLSRPKFKQHALRVNADEDVLWNYSQHLKQEVDNSLVRTPERRIMSGKELARLTETLYGIDDQSLCQPASITRLEAIIESSRSSFDKGMAAGPQLWCHEYAPTCWQEVLEPQRKALHDWLSNLKVHQVQTGKLQSKAKPPTPKKRRKRKSDEMDDFIAYSDDDDARSTANGKNAILLVGPSGSGKTASVFAVAQQLGVDSVPLAELDLFAVLHYGCPEQGPAVQLLGSICAAEGHLLSKESLQNLYLTKGRDLRASIMELNLWCQMTVGSQQGGLDWMLPYHDRIKPKPDGSVTRIVSQDTFISGLDLLPADFIEPEGLIQFSQDSLSIRAVDWVRNDVCPGSPESDRLSTLNDMLILSEARSAMDLIDDTATPMVASALWKLSNPAAAPSAYTSQRNEVVRLYLGELNESQLLQSSICKAFEPLLEESRIGLPSSPGRKAPSLDNPSASSLVTEVAPYIRYIVSHDQRLQQMRNELHGASQHGIKRQRRTRAARAALEGGTKDTVRRDKWFPEELDWGAVMRTGNEWPQTKDVEIWDSSETQTPSSSIGMEVEADEPPLRKY
ncbi:hypothetical protein CLAIMM_04763 isoform 2 [Cladophialophora immunda]|nr:hypothetical protein CLAIMM_04763 isoform 2 [Cladophialophora immunda]